MGLPDHLRLMRSRTSRAYAGRGYARRLLSAVVEELSLPVEPVSMYEVVERYGQWEWLDGNHGTLSPYALLGHPPPDEALPRAPDAEEMR